MIKKPVLTLALATIACMSNAQVQQGSFKFEGRIRDYIVFLPQNFQPDMPVVFVLHGYTDNAYWQMNYTHMNNVADTTGFIAVYPNAISPGFNTGLVYGNWPPLPTNVDDVGFISALIDKIESQYDVDLNRVYCCGFSNGGIMTLKLACQLGHRFAAFGSVSGVLLDPIVANYSLVGSVPMLLCHGTDDVTVHYNGGPYPMMWSVEETLDFWIQNNNCVLTPDTVAIPDTCLLDYSYVQKICYTNCADSVQVVLYKVINGGHSWPSGNQNITWGSEGNKNRDINANIELWNFFKNYQNPLANMAFGKAMEVSPFYFHPLSDTLKVSARLSNPEDHQVKLSAIIQGKQFTFVDSVQLFDDGLHNDGDSADNIWSNIKLLPGLPEDEYKVDLVTHDLTFGIDHYYYQPARVINFGPVNIGDYTFDESDTIPNPGDRLKLKIALRNNGSMATATNIKAGLISLDSLVSVPSTSYTFEDITAGENSAYVTYSIKISEDCPANTEVPIAVNISNHNHICWSDTISIIVQEPAVNIKDIIEPVTRIYPNPADNMLNFEISNNDLQGIEIEILTVTGAVIYQKEYKNTDALFVEQIDLSSYIKGIYLVKVRQANSVYIGKVVVK